jgi:hypothetical protein
MGNNLEKTWKNIGKTKSGKWWTNRKQDLSSFMMLGLVGLEFPTTTNPGNQPV